MSVGRNFVSDLVALAAVPGLEGLAAVYEEYGSHALGRRGDPLSMVIFDGARAIAGSANQAASLFSHTDLWERVRRSAASVGRSLSEQAPDLRAVHRFRQQARSGMAEAYAEALCGSAVEVGRAVGLGRPEVRPCWVAPRREHVLYADGSVWKPLSDVSVDAATGEVKGSRSGGVRGPRVTERFVGKKGGDAGTGLPIVVAGAHGGLRFQRVIYGVSLYRDGDEIGAAAELLKRIVVASDFGFWAVVYDRLMNGRVMRELMRAGLVPVVEMPAARVHRRHVLLPSALARGRKRGKEKTRLQIFDLELVEGPCGCKVDLWALDGTLVAVRPGFAVSLDALVAPLVRLERVGAPGAFEFLGVHRVPCRQGGFLHTVHYSGSRRGTMKNGELPALADYLRPIPETSSEFERLHGYRQDAESVISWFKRNVPLHGRATSLDPEWFLLDMVGFALWCNAVAWDVHAAQHTRCGEFLARRIRRSCAA